MLFDTIVTSEVGLLLKKGVVSTIIEIPNDESRAVFLPWETIANVQMVGNRGQVKTVHGSGFDFDATKLFEPICLAFAKYLADKAGSTIELEVEEEPDVVD